MTTTQSDIPFIFINKLTKNNENDFKIFGKNKITCGYLHEKFIVMGCSNGHVFIFDHLGYLFLKYTKLKTAISEVELDLRGENMLISSKTSIVKIIGIISHDEYTFELDKEITAAAMPDDFSQKNVKCIIVSCNKRILLVEKKLFGCVKTIIYANEENSLIIRWKNRFIAWADSLSACIYDVDMRQLIGYISFRERQINPKNFFVNIIWGNDNILYIAIENIVQIFCIQKCDINKATTTTLYNFMKLNQKKIYLDFIFYSSSVFGALELLTLRTMFAYDKRYPTTVISTLGIICISKNLMSSLEDSNKIKIQLNFNIYSHKGNTIIKDGSQENIFKITQKDSKMISFSLNSEPCFYLCHDNHVYTLKYIIIRIIFYKTITFYIEECIKIQKIEKTIKIIKIIVHLIPIILSNENSKSSPLDLYDKVLVALLYQNQKLFCEYIIKWPNSLYDSNKLIGLINSSNIISTENSYILSAKALFLKDLKVFELITQHSLFSHVVSYLNDLLEIDSNVHPYVLIQHVVGVLKSNEQIFLSYLTQLHNENSNLTKDYTDIHLELCIKYTPNNLYTILHNSVDYDVPKVTTKYTNKF
ncbi:hypothetical protein HZS_3172 [Henneguya salminicola]|nr:hypothetical protein HZS_3172 [Henneguya salminicola]